MRLRYSVLGALLILLSPPICYGDGGRVQLHTPAGPFVVTLFSTPDDLTTAPMDLSAGVEDAATGELVHDATIQLALIALDPGTTDRMMTTLTYAKSSTILPSAEITFPHPGHWRIKIDIIEHGRHGACSMEAVVLPTRRKNYEVWTAALIPLAFILLFLLHTWRKQIWKQQRATRISAA